MDLSNLVDYEQFENEINEKAQAIDHYHKQLELLHRMLEAAKNRRVQLHSQIKELRAEIHILNNFVLNNISVNQSIESIDGPAEERQQDREQLAVLFRSLNHAKQESAENYRHITGLQNDIRICKEHLQYKIALTSERNPDYFLPEDDFSFENDIFLDADESSGDAYDSWLDEMLNKADAKLHNQYIN